MKRRNAVMGLSLLVHGGIALAVGGIDAKRLREVTAIQIAEAAKKNDAKKAEEKPRPPKADKPKRAAAKKAAEQAAPPPPTPAAPLDALPDFGFELSGGVQGGAGVALSAARGTPAAAGPARVQAAVPVVKRVAKVAAPASSDGCDEPPAKPKPKNVPQPAYPEQALGAGIEGKVRVQITVDEQGRVVEVKLLQGLGYGLDEAALAAARQASFEPAIRCGKPTRATFTVSMRFKKP